MKVWPDDERPAPLGKRMVAAVQQIGDQEARQRSQAERAVKKVPKPRWTQKPLWWFTGGWRTEAAPLKYTVVVSVDKPRGYWFRSDD